MGQQTKIQYCDSTWNPISGCLHGCEYCYARNIAQRFGNKECESGIIHADSPYPMKEWRFGGTKGKEISSRIIPYPYGFDPTFHPYMLDKPTHWKKPRTIFVCSMADIFGEWVPDDWIQAVFDACEKAPQHKYLFLTKNPGRYIEMYNKGMMPKEAGNKWYGTTTTTADKKWFTINEKARGVTHNGFLSVEPIQSDFPAAFNMRDTGIKWIIVGAETGNRKDKIIPERKWVEHLMECCAKNGIPIFMKWSLHRLMGDDFTQEYPW